MVSVTPKVEVTGVEAGGSALNTSLDAVPALLVRLKSAGVATPEALAVTV